MKQFDELLKTAYAPALNKRLSQPSELRVKFAMMANGKDIGQTTILIPKTWWQHAKKDLAPQWFLRLFPVQYNQMVVTAKECELDGKRYVRLSVDRVREWRLKYASE